MPVSVESLIKILPTIVVILIGIWLLKKIFNTLIAFTFISIIIFIVSKYVY